MGKKVTKKLAQDLIKNNFGLSAANLMVDDNQRRFVFSYGKDFWIAIYSHMYKASRSTYEYFYTDDMQYNDFYSDHYISVDICIGGQRQLAKYTHDLKLINFKYRDDEDEE